VDSLVFRKADSKTSVSEFADDAYDRDLLQPFARIRVTGDFLTIVSESLTEKST
jgi:hypothetical protein